MARRFLQCSHLLLVFTSVLIVQLCLPVFSSKCDTCRSIASKFNEGLEKTSKSNFGGGNTNWEERKLGTYAASETRLLEILDQCCDGDSKECHYMIEENEEIIEDWWFNDYAKNKKDNLLESFCINSIKVCCPKNTYGKNCKPCPGGTDRPCSGNGRCQGEGMRDGSGSCQCDLGYEGEHCDKCSSGYFLESTNDTHIVCTACHRSCNSSCTGPTAKDCQQCAEGWVHNESEGCIDVDECIENEHRDDKKLCADHQYCENTEGSYLCRECDISCDGCKGAGSSSCVLCAEKFFLDSSNSCTACHKSCRNSCTDATHTSCDLCADGWIYISDQGCQDIDECAKGRFECSNNTFCLNTEGSYVCKACHETCKGCTGPGPTECMLCNGGYKRSQDLTECIDVDECVENSDTVCTGLGEKCINTIGSYKCTCLEDYVMVRGGKCQLKNKNNSKKKIKNKDSSTATSEIPEKTDQQQQPKDVPGEKNFEGRLEENMEGFREALNQARAPTQGVPLEEMVVMEGQLNIPGSKDGNEETLNKENVVRKDDSEPVTSHPREEL